MTQYYWNGCHRRPRYGRAFRVAMTPVVWMAMAAFTVWLAVMGWPQCPGNRGKGAAHCGR